MQGMCKVARWIFISIVLCSCNATELDSNNATESDGYNAIEMDDNNTTDMDGYTRYQLAPLAPGSEVKTQYRVKELRVMDSTLLLNGSWWLVGLEYSSLTNFINSNPLSQCHIFEYETRIYDKPFGFYDEDHCVVINEDVIDYLGSSYSRLYKPSIDPSLNILLYSISERAFCYVTNDIEPQMYRSNLKIVWNDRDGSIYKHYDSILSISISDWHYSGYSKMRTYDNICMLHLKDSSLLYLFDDTGQITRRPHKILAPGMNLPEDVISAAIYDKYLIVARAGSDGADEIVSYQILNDLSLLDNYSLGIYDIAGETPWTNIFEIYENQLIWVNDGMLCTLDLDGKLSTLGRMSR